MTTSLPLAPARQKRERYSAHLKNEVRRRYPLCQSIDDKQALADALGIDSLHKLYNLASRIGVTRPSVNSPAHNVRRSYEPRHDATRLALREDPSSTTFADTDDLYIRTHYGRQHVEEIAYLLDHTETAVMYRARQLGVRKPVWFWELRKVLAWLNLSEAELRELGRPVGLEIYHCQDRFGSLCVGLVDAPSLARTLLHQGNWRRLVGEQNADRFFIREALQAEVDVRNGAEREQTHWVSHGRTCLSPLAGAAFGWFDDGTDMKLPGRGLHPRDLTAKRIGQLFRYGT